jgi:hypothetical protein
MRRNAYFEYGNSQGAPHDLTISVSGIKYDCESFWDQANNKGFYYSQFYEDDNYTILANNKIVAPINPFGQSGDISNDVEVLSGAQITFFAGNEIHLRHGFHAEAGSHFHAKVITKKEDMDTISNLFTPIVPDSLISYQAVPDSILTLYKKEENAQHYSTLLPTEEEEQTSTFSIYPNPSKGHFTLQVPVENNTKYSVECFNAMGYSVLKREGVSLDKLPIDLSRLSRGIYIVKAIVGDKIYLQKIVLI